MIHQQDRCVPEELPALKKVLSEISILRYVKVDQSHCELQTCCFSSSPNAEEAFSLLGNLQTSPTRASIELAAQEFLRYGIGEGKGSIIIRSGGLGACVAKYGERPRWVNAYWEPHNARDHNKIIDVTGIATGCSYFYQVKLYLLKVLVIRSWAASLLDYTLHRISMKVGSHEASRYPKYLMDRFSNILCFNRSIIRS